MIEWLALILLIPAILVPLVLLLGFAGCDVVFGLQEVPPPPVFETSFEAVLTEDRQRPNRCIVQRIESLGKSGDLVRIAVQRPTNGDLTINELFISQVADAGDPYDSAPDLTRVLSAPVAVPQDPNNGPWELEAVEYPLDHTKPLLLAFDIASAGTVRRAVGVDPAMAVAYVGPLPAAPGDPPIHEASMADRQAGYAEQPIIYLVQRIDVA